MLREQNSTEDRPADDVTEAVYDGIGSEAMEVVAWPDFRSW